MKWRATPELRFVEREQIKGLGHHRILQQMWIKPHPQMQGERIGWDEEWRDIPLMDVPLMEEQRGKVNGIL